MREVIDVMPRLVDGDERAAADVVEMTWHAARALSAASALFPRPDGFGRVDGARWWHDAFLETRDRFAERARPCLPSGRR